MFTCIYIPKESVIFSFIRILYLDEECARMVKEEFLANEKQLKGKGMIEKQLKEEFLAIEKQQKDSFTARISFSFKRNGSRYM